MQYSKTALSQTPIFPILIINYSGTWVIQKSPCAKAEFDENIYVFKEELRSSTFEFEGSNSNDMGPAYGWSKSAYIAGSYKSKNTLNPEKWI